MHTTAPPHDRRPQEPRRTDIPAEPDTLIDVTPAYLAGRSYANQVFERLTGEWAWGHGTTELSQSFAWSPDHRFRIADGQLDPGAWWHIAAARDPLAPPQWQAGFSKETPPEFVTAVAEELARTGSGIDWTGEGHPALKAPTDRRTLIRTLRDAGWRSTYRNGELDLEAPDRLARVQIRIDPPGDALDLMSRPHLYVEIGPRDNGGYPPYWQAMFTTNAPTAAVDALAQALTSPTPLRRDRDWMGEELLKHLGEKATNDSPGNTTAGQPTARVEAPPYTDEDLLAVAIDLSAEAMESIEDFRDADMIGDQVIPSTRATAARTWDDLPQDQKHLAYTLLTDMVLDAARRAPLLFGREPEPGSAPRRASRLPTPQLHTPLRDLSFTNEDLRAAAVWLGERRMYWDPSALSDAMWDEIILSTAGHAEPRTWGTLPYQQHEEAIRRAEKLISDAAERATLLFDRPSGPEPLALVSPLYLAGPGHHGRDLAAAPLRDRGWTVAQEPGGATVYTSPCARVIARARTDSTGTAWTTTHRRPLSGGEQWWSSADGCTPTEITAALHEALATTLEGRPHDLFHPVAPNTDALDSVIDAGWHDRYSGPNRISWTAPNAEMATITRLITMHSPDQSTDWVISGGSFGSGSRGGWYLEMPANVPAPLLAGVTEALADPAPVARLGRDLTSENLVHLDVRPLETRRRTTSPARVAAARTRTVGTAYEGQGVRAETTCLGSNGRQPQAR
ncbi:DUF317 domain-containing protein [Kitasatospora sp. NPDC091335]|uniref:DUF317 domain-containing protein n=1 Tax=Kitasatospora sp. NPDC091335 TaxID=3364085 RepID=UPI00381B2EEE